MYTYTVIILKTLKILIFEPDPAFKNYSPFKKKPIAKISTISYKMLKQALGRHLEIDFGVENQNISQENI
jgi:hypothetical protein